MANVKITARKNGSYRVEGPVDLYYDDQKIEIPEGPYFSLCRCGASSKKPFCDGAHSKIGFQAAAEKVPESKE